VRRVGHKLEGIRVGVWYRRSRAFAPAAAPACASIATPALAPLPALQQTDTCLRDGASNDTAGEPALSVEGHARKVIDKAMDEQLCSAPLLSRACACPTCPLLLPPVLRCPYPCLCLPCCLPVCESLMYIPAVDP